MGFLLLLYHLLFCLDLCGWHKEGGQGGEDHPFLNYDAMD